MRIEGRAQCGGALGFWVYALGFRVSGLEGWISSVHFQDWGWRVEPKGPMWAYRLGFRI